MHKRIRRALAASTAAALTGGLLTAAASPAAADPAAKNDFNGDGRSDVAVSAGDAYVAGHKGAGQIVVLYGGLTPDRHKTVSQNTSGVPGTAEASDGFGWGSAIGDFNHDGYSDLAVSAPYEDVGSDVDGGTVAIMWGSSSGLSGGTTISDPAPSSHDKWGRALAAGDFDGDGKDDLAIGSTSSTVYVYKAGISKSGTAGGRYTVKAPVQSGGSAGPLNLTAGDVNNDGRHDLIVNGYEATGTSHWNTNYFIPGSATGLRVSSAVKLQGGITSAIGDVNGDTYGDIVIGVSWDGTSGVPGAVKGGRVHVIYGSATGPSSTTASISQDSGAVPDSSEAGDGFGYELSLGDVNSDGYQDLAVSAVGEDTPNGMKDAGAVTILYGSAGGLDTTNNVQFFHQDTPGFPGAAEGGDQLGSDVQLANTDGYGGADMVIGAMGENGNGTIVSMENSLASPTFSAYRASVIDPSEVGVSTTGNPYFGANFGN
ncbi:FG-GAP-like repeat-containing protein [Streptomyces sp. R41]|uniref:FG-GAP-like repeat-containing protein n=1 Tax=Streptomyces sp. R41 TaxID=3238632 RepID=A0AB39R9Y5_9ACTN